MSVKDAYDLAAEIIEVTDDENTSLNRQEWIQVIAEILLRPRK